LVTRRKDGKVRLTSPNSLPYLVRVGVRVRVRVRVRLRGRGRVRG